LKSIYNLFGLPSAKKSGTEEAVALDAELIPEGEAGDRPVHELKFHDLAQQRWLDWSRSHLPGPHRGLRYVRPDEMHRLPFDGIHARVGQGDTIVVDLSILAHMDSQRAALTRQLQGVADAAGCPVFALDEKEYLLLVPGIGINVDTETHELGTPPGIID